MALTCNSLKPKFIHQNRTWNLLIPLKKDKLWRTCSSRNRRNPDLNLEKSELRKSNLYKPKFVYQNQTMIPPEQTKNFEPWMVEPMKTGFDQTLAWAWTQSNRLIHEWRQKPENTWQFWTFNMAWRNLNESFDSSNRGQKFYFSTTSNATTCLALVFFHVGMLRFYLTPIFKWNDLTLLKKNMGAFELLFWRENGRV